MSVADMVPDQRAAHLLDERLARIRPLEHEGLAKHRGQGRGFVAGSGQRREGERLALPGEWLAVGGIGRDQHLRGCPFGRDAVHQLAARGEIGEGIALDEIATVLVAQRSEGNQVQRAIR
jgi:hypothetical protein